MPINFNEKLKNEKENEKDKNSDFYKLSEPKYCREDMVMNQNMEMQLLEVIGYIQYSDKVYSEWGLEKVMKREQGVFINLYGPSGTGKTMMAHIIAQQLRKEILQVNYAEIESKYVGETAKNLQVLFKMAEENEGVLFFDEADALLSKRVTEMSSAADVSVNQTRSVLLKLLDEFRGVCVFATNFLSNYDYAFLRRITKFVKFDYPDLNQRLELWKHYLVPELPCEIDINNIAEQYDKVSGSDIKNAILSAAIRTVVKGEKIVSMDTMVSVIEEIIDARNKDYLQIEYEGGERT